MEIKGLIANVGSVNQTLTPPYQAAYNASEAALAALGISCVWSSRPSVSVLLP